MKYKALRAVIVMGDYVARESIIDIDPILGKTIGEEYLIPLELYKEIPAQVESVLIPEDKVLEKLKQTDLIKIAEKLKLSTSGRRSDLIERIKLSKIK